MFVASIIRNRLCIIYDVFYHFFQKSLFTENYLLISDKFNYPGSIVYLSCFDPYHHIGLEIWWKLFRHTFQEELFAKSRYPWYCSSELEMWHEISFFASNRAGPQKIKFEEIFAIKNSYITKQKIGFLKLKVLIDFNDQFCCSCDKLQNLW